MRKLMWFSLGFCGACFCCAYFYNPWILQHSLAALVLGAVCFGLSIRFRILRICVAVFLGIAVGFAGFRIFDGAYLQRVRTLDEQTVSLLIIADDYSTPTNYGCTFEGTVYFENVLYRVRTYLNGEVSAEPGDLFEGNFKLNFTADGGDDVSPIYRGKGVFLVASQRGDISKFAGAYYRWYHYPAVWRDSLRGLIDLSFAEDTAVFAKALLLGDTTDLDYETDTAFKVSGIRHIIAVSGLHVSILFGIIYLLTAKKRVLTALLGISAVVLFAAVVGFSPSVTRASLMQILMMLALLFDREYDPLTALAFAALVILGVNPLTVTSVSFQLSAGCMTGIFLVSAPIRGWLLDPKRLGRWKGKTLPGKIASWFSGSVSVTLGAMLLTTPLSAYYFGAVSLVGVLTNVLTLWVVTVVFYGVMAACVVGLISAGASGFIGWIIGWPIRYVLFTAKTLASFPFAAVYTRHISTVIWLMFCYLLLGIFLLQKKKDVPVFCALGVTGLLLAIACSWSTQKVDEYRITVMNVGQGQSILLQSEGRAFLVDCGGDHDETAADIAAETVLSMGITKLDGVILTHYDTDHSAGVPHLLSRVDADLIYLPYSMDEHGVGAKILAITSATVNTVRDDLVLSFGDCRLTLYAPDSYNSGNESSMCILFQTENCDILITGDRGTKGEEMLIRRHDLPDLEILVAGHHGAKDSVSELLLSETRPEYVAISVGANNSYGHPTWEVLERLDRYGCEVYRTDRDGCIVFRG